MSRTPLQTVLCLAASGMLCTTLTGCIVAGASSSGGWFIWPGGFGLLILILLVALVLRRR